MDVFIAVALIIIGAITIFNFFAMLYIVKIFNTLPGLVNDGKTVFSKLKIWLKHMDETL